MRYKKEFFKKYRKGPNHGFFGFKKKYLKDKDKVILLLSDHDISIDRLNRAYQDKTTIYLFFLGILIGALPGFFSVWLSKRREFFYILLGIFIIIFGISLYFFYKKLKEEEDFCYGKILKIRNKLKDLGIEFNEKHGF